MKNLSYPEYFLTDADNYEFAAYKRKWRAEDKNLNIINFNYTNSVRKIIEKHNINAPIAHDAYSKYYLRDLLHIHGFTTERTILGVNDLSQVSNPRFHNDTDFIEALIK